MATVDLWFVSAGTDRATVTAWLQQAPDGRVILAISDADAIDIGVELRETRRAAAAGRPVPAAG